MPLSSFKPMRRPMPDQPMDLDFFNSIYDAVNSLSNSNAVYTLDDTAQPWGDVAPDLDASTASQATGLQINVLAGVVAVNDGDSKKQTGKRTWTVTFPTSAAFTAPPIVVVTPVFANSGSSPVATCIEWVSTKQFRVSAQSVDNNTINVSHFNYIAYAY